MSIDESEAGDAYLPIYTISAAAAAVLSRDSSRMCFPCQALRRALDDDDGFFVRLNYSLLCTDAIARLFFSLSLFLAENSL